MMTYKRFHEDRVLTGRVRATGRSKRSRARRRSRPRRDVLGKVEGGKLGVVLSAQQLERGQLRARQARHASTSAPTSSTSRPSVAGRATTSSATPTTTRTARARRRCGGALGTMEQLVRRRRVRRGHGGPLPRLGDEPRPSRSSRRSRTGSATAHVNLTSNAGALTSSASVVVPVAWSRRPAAPSSTPRAWRSTSSRAVRAPGGIESAWQTLVEIGRLLGWHDRLQASERRAAGDAPAAPRRDRRRRSRRRPPEAEAAIHGAPDRFDAPQDRLRARDPPRRSPPSWCGPSAGRAR